VILYRPLTGRHPYRAPGEPPALLPQRTHTRSVPSRHRRSLCFRKTCERRWITLSDDAEQIAWGALCVCGRVDAARRAV